MDKIKKIKRIIEIVNNSDISSIKQIVIKIIKIINDPDSSAKNLKDVIEKDPPLTAKLLRLANSAFYGYSKKISTIQEAIVCIGFEAVKELALRQKVCELFSKEFYFNSYSRLSLWKHCIAVALCGKLIYRMEFQQHGENIYAAGLLHDIGIIISDQFLQNSFIDILTKSKNTKKNLINIEDNVLGFNHTDIGSSLATDWKLPDELVIAIKNHHNFNSIEEKYIKISLSLFVSNYACQNSGIGYNDAPYEDKTKFLKCLEELKLKEKSIELIIEEVKNEIKKIEEIGFI